MTARSRWGREAVKKETALSAGVGYRSSAIPLGNRFVGSHSSALNPEGL